MIDKLKFSIEEQRLSFEEIDGYLCSRFNFGDDTMNSSLKQYPTPISQKLNISFQLHMANRLGILTSATRSDRWMKRR